MRDLRRYDSPVIVQIAGQVNIASDGGQQVNVQKSKQGKRRAKAKKSGKRGGKAKPKQLVAKSPDASIKMKAVSGSLPIK